MGTPAQILQCVEVHQSNFRREPYSVRSANIVYVRVIKLKLT